MMWSLSAFEPEIASGSPSRASETEQSYAERSCGVHISDAAIKWLTLSRGQPRARRVEAWGEMPLPSGVVERGAIHDTRALSAALRAIAPHLGKGASVHVALPSEPVSVFGMQIPRGSSRAQTVALVEFECARHTSLSPSAVLYAFDHIPAQSGDETDEVGVALFPREISESYTAAFEAAGIGLASLEHETGAAARAVYPHGRAASAMFLVDVGRTRCRFALVKHEVPIFMSTMSSEGDAQFEALPAEIAHVLSYWDTRRNQRGERVMSIGAIVLVGESAALEGLSEHIARETRVPVEHGDIWQRIADFNDYIPPIDRDTSLSFAVCAGLALREL